MDPIRPNVAGAGGQTLRPIVRHRGLIILAAATTVLALGARYKAVSMHENEKAQKNSPSPNFYVSVDRSGGGI